jgi:hypothetical protein
MVRNKVLIELSPHEHVLVDANRLGALFCGETFEFVLDPCTRSAAERVARWHGCRFQFHDSTGCGAFVKRSRIAGIVVALIESAVQRLERWEHRVSSAAQNPASATRGATTYQTAD